MGTYKLSFTGAYLCLPESYRLAELFAELNDWQLVEQRITSENVLQKISENTIKRQFRELKQRLSNLTPQELNLMINGDYDQQIQMLFLAVCKTYQFIADFVIEVIREKLTIYENQISEADFDIFWLNKSADHPEVENTLPSTRQKLKNVLFRILETAGLLQKEAGLWRITKILVNEETKEIITEDNEAYLMFFLL